MTLNDWRVGSPLAGNIDYLSFPAGVNLGQVAFAQNYMGNNLTATFATSTMSASTVTVSGRQVTRVTITLSARTGSAPEHRQQQRADQKWTPSASVTDTFGNPSSTAVVNETGTADVDL